MEGSIKAAHKVQAMKQDKRAQFLYNFVLYSLTSLITCFFFSYHFWLPSISITNLIITSLSLPNAISFASNTKCFFLVGNLIVLILIGESKLSRSSSRSSPALDMYNEYAARSWRAYSKDHKVDSKVKLQVNENVTEIHQVSSEDKKRRMLAKKRDIMGVKKIEGCGGGDQGEIGKMEKTKRENGNMPREELNKRVEAFIARVNKKRVMETKFVDQS